MNQSNLSALVDAIRSAGYHVSTTVMVSHHVLHGTTEVSNMVFFFCSFFLFLTSLCVYCRYITMKSTVALVVVYFASGDGESEADCDNRWW